MKQIRIVLTGSECTGKSTLATQLATHYGVTCVPEYLREYFELKNGILSLEDAIPIAMGQLKLEQEAEKSGSNPLICDTNALSSVIYSRHYFKFCPNWIEELLEKRSWDLYLLCETDIQWQPDGQRDRPAERKYMHGFFRKELTERKLPFIEIAGTAEQRLIKAIQAVDNIILKQNS